MKRGHDLSGVMKFATSPAWGEHLGEALGDHLGLAMEEFDFEADELADIVGDHWAGVLRSEEHTSELQSLMRISYAVFCLTNKTNNQVSNPPVTEQTKTQY